MIVEVPHMAVFEEVPQTDPNMKAEGARIETAVFPTEA
jgi:hypothetical protein